MIYIKLNFGIAYLNWIEKTHLEGDFTIFHSI